MAGPIEEDRTNVIRFVSCSGQNGVNSLNPGS
jgi:hypothetical protein